MVRNTGIDEQPLDIVVQFARHYTHGPHSQYDHLFFFSKIKGECEALLVFGGYVYKQRNGYVWFLGNRKNLVALYKLLEARSDLSDEMLNFINRMKDQGVE